MRRLGEAARHHARRRLDHRAARGPREALEHVPRLRPRGRARRDLPQDPPVRRRGRRPHLPRVRSRGAGEEPVVAEVEGWPIGLTICYDLRFPELYRVLALEGALLATVPAHFTLYTGKDHWHLLLRARAVENRLLRRGAGAGRGDRDRPPELRPLADRRPVGHGARAGARRGDGDLRPSSTGRGSRRCGAACRRCPQRRPRRTAGQRRR